MLGRSEAVETPIGAVPTAIVRDGLDLSDATLTELLRVDRAEWAAEAAQQADFLRAYGDRMPRAIWDEHAALVERTTA